MNKPIRSNVINGDESARATAASGNAGAGEAQTSTSTGSASSPSPAQAGYQRAVDQATAEHQAAKARSATSTTPPPVQPAFNTPATNPATPRDEHHGKGGEYHMVDGKRLRVEPQK